MADQKERILLNLSINTDELTDRVINAKKEIQRLKEENKQFAKESADALKKGLTASYDELNRKIVENEGKVRSLNTEQRNSQKTLDLVAQSNKAGAGSYEELLRQQQLAQTSLKLLEGTIKQNADGTIELTEEYKLAAGEVKKAKDAIIQFDQGISDGRSNVGNYSASITDALERTGLFSGALGTARQAFSGIKTGTDVAKEGFELLSKGVNGSIDAVTKWFSVTNQADDVTQTFTTMAGAVGEVNDETKASAVSTKTLETVQKSATTSGVIGFRALAVAIATTGIGLLLIALGGLVALFTKTEAGAELLERKFAAIGGIIDVLIGSFVGVGQFVFDIFNKPQEALEKLTSFINDTAIKAIKGYLNVLAGIVTLDFDRVKEGVASISKGAENAVAPVKGLAKSMSEAAKSAEELKAREQDLEDAYRNSAVEIEKNKNEVDKLLLSTKEKAKSDAEKIALLQQAGKIEERNIAIQKKLAIEGLAIEKDRNAELEKRGLLRDEDVDKAVQAEIKLNSVLQDSEKTLAKIKIREANTVNEIAKERLAVTLSLLSDELAIAQLKGEETIALKKSIAKREREAQLSADLSPAERLKVESEYQRKLIEITEAYNEEKQQLREQAEDLALSFIKDARTREISQEAVDLERKLALIKGKTEEELALKQRLIEASALKIIEIEQRAFDENIKATLESEKKRNTASSEQLNVYYQGKQRSLELALANEKLTQEQFAEKSRQLTVEKLAEEQSLLADQRATRETLLEATYQQEKTLIENSNLSKELLDAELIELERTKQEELVRIKEEFSTKSAEINKKTDDTEYAGQLEQTKRILRDAKARKDAEFNLEQARLELAGTVVAGVKGILEENKQASKAYVLFIKALGLAEIGINLQKELSAIAFNAEANPANVPTAGAFGISYVTIKSAIAIARASFASASILAQKYEKGGNTGGGAETISLAQAMDTYNPKMVGSIADGGRFDSPVLGLIAEKGAEEIFPNWMLRSPVAGPVISSLAKMRDNGMRVLPFADGGITLPDSGFSGAFGGMEAFKEAIQDLKIVTYIQDVRDANDIVNTIETNANV